MTRPILHSSHRRPGEPRTARVRLEVTAIVDGDDPVMLDLGVGAGLVRLSPKDHPDLHRALRRALRRRREDLEATGIEERRLRDRARGAG